MSADSGLPSFHDGTLSDPALTAALKSLELTVRRKLDGVLQGEHLGLIPGPGSEPGRPGRTNPATTSVAWSGL